MALPNGLGNQTDEIVAWGRILNRPDVSQDAHLQADRLIIGSDAFSALIRTGLIEFGQVITPAIQSFTKPQNKIRF